MIRGRDPSTQYFGEKVMIGALSVIKNPRM